MSAGTSIHQTRTRDTVPVIEAFRKIPFAIYNEVKMELERMKKGGMIKKVTQATKWVSAMHIVHKSNGKLRICMDPRNLIKAIIRKHFKLPTHEEVIEKMLGAKIFSKLDCSERFWQLQLDEENSMGSEEGKLYCRLLSDSILRLFYFHPTLSR